MPAQKTVEFPDRNRVIYAKNPLVEVICQIKFPRILDIDAALPAAFQNAIRREYPLFRLREGYRIQVKTPSFESGQEPPKIDTARTYDFLSQDEKWKVSLGGDFVALTATSYTRWEEFRDHLTSCLGVALAIYQPSLFTRIGLRYKDLIVRSVIQKEGTPWRDLIRPPILGLLESREIDESAIVASQSSFQAAVTAGNLHVQHGLVKSAENDEIAYLIDADWSTEEKLSAGADNALAKLELLHETAGKFFRWCITDTLHDAMEPGEVH